MFEIDNAKLKEFQKSGFLLFKKSVPKELYMPILEVAKVHLKYRIAPIESEYEYIGIEKEEYKKSVRRLRQVYDRDVVFREWMRNKMFCEYFKAILRDNPVLVTAHHNSIMTKMPKNSTATDWHRDIRYWSYDNDNLVSVWLALGDEHSENGVLEFIPASHRMELSRDRFDDKLYFRDDLDINRELISTKVSFDLEAGDVVLFHASTLHRANRNVTERAKISFVYTVKGERSRAIEGSRSSLFKEINLC